MLTNTDCTVLLVAYCAACLLTAAVIGPNGAGKSTLIKMILGKEKPDSGTFTVGSTVKLAVVDQDRDSLQGDKSVYDEICGE